MDFVGKSKGNINGEIKDYSRTMVGVIEVSDHLLRLRYSHMHRFYSILQYFYCLISYEAYLRLYQKAIDNGKRIWYNISAVILPAEGR